MFFSFLLNKMALASPMVVGNTTDFRISPVAAMVAMTSCVLKPETMTTPKRMSHQLKAHTRNLNALWKKPNSEPPFEPKRKPIPGRLSPRHKTPNGMAVTIWATLPEQTTTTALPSFKPLVCEKSPKAVNETEAARPIKAHINANRRESWKPNFTEDADSENNAPARAPARISLIPVSYTHLTLPTKA